MPEGILKTLAQESATVCLSTSLPAPAMFISNRLLFDVRPDEDGFRFQPRP